MRSRLGIRCFVFLLDEEEQPPSVSRVEFDDRRPTAETRVIYPKEVVYLQPERLLRELPATSQVARNLNALLKISRVVHAIRDLEELQAQLLDLIFEVVPAGRGAILLAEGTGQEFNCLYARTRQAGQPQLVRVSRTIARQVMKENVAILGVDVAASGALRDVESLAASEVRSLLCVPLSVFQRMIGCIYLDSTNAANRFNEDHLQLTAAVAGISAVASGQCAPAAVAGAGESAPHDGDQARTEPGGRRREDERDFPVRCAGCAQRLDSAD